MRLMIVTAAEIEAVRDMLRRPEGCCALHAKMLGFLELLDAGKPVPRSYNPVWSTFDIWHPGIGFTAQEINEFRGMLRRPEWCCALHTRMLDFLDSPDIKQHLEMETACLAAYVAGERITLTEVIEALR